MGKGGTCKHCGNHIVLPSLFHHRATEAWAAVSPWLLGVCKLPLRLLNHLIVVNFGHDEFAGMSQAERLLVIEARKQTKIQKARRSDTSCCLGCIIILLLLFATGLLGPILAIIGIGGAIGASQ